MNKRGWDGVGVGVVVGVGVAVGVVVGQEQEQGLGRGNGRGSGRNISWGGVGRDRNDAIKVGQRTIKIMLWIV